VEEADREVTSVYYKPSTLYNISWFVFSKIRPTKMFENPISYTDIKDFCELYNISLQIYEIEMILKLDTVFYSEKAKSNK
jgi:hypothetical protein